ncbi:site-2 protease family protein, partial [Bacillus altitudinis]|uniref:site-2 protease family protein n=1 Tax=Bacillus altitudinis TaxID=293387 RepID=UPI001F3D2CF3
MRGEVGKEGVLRLMQFGGFVSMKLGMVNLLRIGGLEGGRLVLLLVEAIRGKAINGEKEGVVVLIGVGFVMVLMVV